MQEATISKKKVSIINLAINYANTFFLILNGLILVPIYFKYFSLSIYGSYLAAANIAGILALLEFGLSLVLTQKLSFLYKLKDYESFYKLLKAGLIISFILVATLLAIALIICPFVPVWVKALPKDYVDIRYAFILNCLGMGLNIYSNTLTSIFQAWSKVQVSGIINVVSAFIGVLSTLFGLYYGFGVSSISLGIFAKGLFCVLGLVPFLIINVKKDNYPKSKVDKKIYFGILKDSLPVFGNTLSKSLIDNGQLLIITNFLSPTVTAIFALTTKVYQVCSNLLAPIGSSIFSSLSQLVGENDTSHLKASILKIFSLFTLFSVLLLTISFALNNSFMTLWVGADKAGGVLLSLMVCVNIFVSSRFAYINFNLFALGIFGKTVLYDQLAAISRIVLIFFLINVIGILAIPVSELIATLIFCGYFLNKLFIERMQFNSVEIRKVLFGGVIEFASFILLGFLFQYLFPQAQSWKAFIFEGFVFSIVLFSVLLVLNKEVFLSYTNKFLKKKA